MPLLIWIYLAALIIVLGFSEYSFLTHFRQLKQKRSLFLLCEVYDVVSTLALMFMICAYYLPSFRSFTDFWTVILFCVILTLDFYASVLAPDDLLPWEEWDKIMADSLQKQLRESGQEENVIPHEVLINVELSRVISLIWMAPAYIICALLSAEIILKK